MHSQLAFQSEPALAAFYAEHPNPLWISDGRLRPEAQTVVASRRVGDGELAAIVARAEQGRPDDLARAELALSAALVEASLKPPASSVRIVFADPVLAPPRDGLAALRAAARAQSLDTHLKRLRYGNALQAEFARAANRTDLTPQTRAKVEVNLERLRALPADLGQRFVLVDIPAARLWLYEDGAPVKAMQIVVGAKDDPTPLMAAMLRSVVLNPYWNMPPDLVSERIAPKVLRSGVHVLADQDLEVLSGWAPTARPVRADTVDWSAVAQGAKIRVRQRPGPANTLGRVKFVMPNKLGIFLHDTPERSSLSARSAYRSAGCVRLADADALGVWLLGEQWDRNEQRQEIQMKLAAPVPIYIVYRTVRFEGGAVIYLPDPYGLDAARLTPRADGSPPRIARAEPQLGDG